MNGVLDVIPAGLVTGGGLASLVSLAVWMIYTGRLVPRRLYEDLKADRDDWKKAEGVRAEQNATMTRQVDTLIEQGRTTERAMLALQNLIQQTQREQHDRGRGSRS